MNTRTPHTIFTWIAMLAALIMSSGFALLAAAGPTSAAEDDCIPRDAYTETTGWVLESPGAGWYQVDTRVVTDTPARDETVVDQEAYDDPPTTSARVWHVLRGWGKDHPGETPSLTNAGWAEHANEPNGQHAYPGENGLNVPYQPGADKGNGDWFYWSGGVLVPGAHHDAVTHVVHHAAVTHTELRFAFDHPAVECDQVEPPVEPPVVNPPVEEVSPPTVAEKATVQVSPPTAAEKVTTEPTIPSAVHAGLVGEPTTSSTAPGLILVVAGALMLAVGALGTMRTPRPAHHG